MFTGIVQDTARICNINDHEGLRTFVIEFPAGFCHGLKVGASVSVDGVCLTVTEIVSPTKTKFDVVLQSLRITTLSRHLEGQIVNVERAARDGAEIGGHPLSGHIDFCTQIIDIKEIEGNCRVRFHCKAQWRPYIFPKGYIAINGCSLTLSEVDKKQGYFEVWLIPETRRVTTFADKGIGDWVNIEIERGTQVVVDTIKDTLEKHLGALYPAFETLLAERQIDLTSSVLKALALPETAEDTSRQNQESANAIGDMPR
ncbi:riboflavin synthase subunit alpha [Pseudocitrobacter corydidari]